MTEEKLVHYAGMLILAFFMGAMVAFLFRITEALEKMSACGIVG